MGLPSVGPVELIIVLAIALLVVGPSKLPEMGSAFGRTIREFRKSATGLSDITDAAQAATDPDRAEPAARSNTAAAPPQTPPFERPETEAAPAPATTSATPEIGPQAAKADDSA